jgi:hypothetical protein
MIPRQVVVMRTANHIHDRVSRVKHFDAMMKNVFAYFVKVPAEVAGELTDALGKGYSEEGYGPFWPSFSSLNSGDDVNKVLWLSEAAVICLRTNLPGRYYFQLEPHKDEND